MPTASVSPPHHVSVGMRQGLGLRQATLSGRVAGRVAATTSYIHGGGGGGSCSSFSSTSDGAVAIDPALAADQAAARAAAAASGGGGGESEGTFGDHILLERPHGVMVVRLSIYSTNCTLYIAPTVLYI